MPAAPQEHGRVLRPRQVRAGIPRPLDALCDQVVNPYAGPGSRDGHDLATARGIGDFLREFVGDPTGMAEAEAAHHAGPRTVVLPIVPPGVPGLPRQAPAARRDPEPISRAGARRRPQPRDRGARRGHRRGGTRRGGAGRRSGR